MANKGSTRSSSKTPSKSKVKTTQPPSLFAIPELRSPNKVCESGVPRTIYTHTSTLQGLLGDWRRLRSRGAALCRAVLALRLHECEEGEYPAKLAPLIESLTEALSGLRSVVDSIQLLDTQLQALAMLEPSAEPVFSTWSAGRIAQKFNDIYLEYQREYQLKKYVTESVAHCRDEAVSETLASAWELEAYVDPDRQLYLFTELGIPA